jgi:hypothetical protein
MAFLPFRRIARRSCPDPGRAGYDYTARLAAKIRTVTREQRITTKREQCRQRFQRVNRRRGHAGRHAEDFQRQGVVAAGS